MSPLMMTSLPRLPAWDLYLWPLPVVAVMQAMVRDIPLLCLHVLAKLIQPEINFFNQEVRNCSTSLFPDLYLSRSLQVRHFQSSCLLPIRVLVCWMLYLMPHCLH